MTKSEFPQYYFESVRENSAYVVSSKEESNLFVTLDINGKKVIHTNNRHDNKH